MSRQDLSSRERGRAAKSQKTNDVMQDKHGPVFAFRPVMMRTHLPARLRLVRLLPAAALSVLGAACGDGTSLPSGRWQGAGSGSNGPSSAASASAPGGSTAGSPGGSSSAATGSGSGAPGSSSGASGSSSGAGSSSSSGSNPPPAAPNLKVSLDQTSLQMQLLAQTPLHVSVAPNGYSGAVTLQAGSLPAGLTATFSPPSVVLDGTNSGASTVTLSTVDSTPPGAVSLDVQAVAEGTTAHASVSVEVQSIITIHIPSGVNGLGGTTSNPVKDAYGPYPFKIAAPANMSSSAPVTVYFMNDDGQPHEVHADNAQQGFGHDPGPFGAHTMDPYVRMVTTPGSYDFYLHDQGAPITIGLVEIQ